MNQSWSNFKVLSAIFLEVLRKTTKNHNRDRRSPGRELNPEPPEYEGVRSRVLTAASMKMRVLWDITLCSLVGVN
jgi:hypothetical protein